MGSAELGVVDVEVGAVEADNRLVEDEDMGVYGDARGCGEPSFILADLGGTSGGVLPLPDRSRDMDVCGVRRGCDGDDEGMTRGANDFGERGCFGEADRV